MTTDHDVVVADDLDAAADVIDARGWCQNNLADPDGRVCAEGAIIAAVAGFERMEFADTGWAREWLGTASTATPEVYHRYAGRIGSAMDALREYLYRTGYRAAGEEIFHWNDRRSQTRDEVTDTFRRAAKDARERAGGAS